MLVRLIVGVMAAALAIAALCLGGVALWALIAIASFLSVHEMNSTLKAPLLVKIPSYAFAALFAPFMALDNLAWVIALLLACVLFVFVSFAVLGGEGGKLGFKDVLSGMFPFCYPLMFLFFFALMMTMPHRDYVPAFLLICGCPLFSDTFAFFFGKLLGRRKLAPRVSPNKTIEGAAAGLFGGMAFGALVFFVLGWWSVETALWKFLVVGLILAAAGELGDLFASALKRHFGLKDFGRLLPGHGGMLDRIDSVLFCAPVYFICYMLNPLTFN